MSGIQRELRRKIITMGAKPGTHRLELNLTDSETLAVEYYELDLTWLLNGFNTKMNFTDFLEKLRAGEISNLTFRGLKVKWFRDKTQVMPKELVAEPTADQKIKAELLILYKHLRTVARIRGIEACLPDPPEELKELLEYEKGSLVDCPDVARPMPDGINDEPEVVKCVVNADKHGFLFVRMYGDTIYLDSVCKYPDFIGFLYEDGRVQFISRRYKFQHGVIGERVQEAIISTVEVLTPTHVLFKK